MPIPTAAIGQATQSGTSILSVILPFLKNLNPQRNNDTAIANAVLEAAYQVWEAVTGENLRNSTTFRGGGPGTGVPSDDPNVGATVHSVYPNVPKGAAGDLSADIDELILQLRTVIAQGQSRCLLETSKLNLVFTNGAGGILALLQQVKAYREANPLTTITSPGNLKAAGGLALGALALVLLKWKGVF